MEMCADPVPHQVTDHAISETFRILLNGCRDVMQMIPGPGIFNTFEKTLPGHINQLLRFSADLPDSHRSCGIRVEPLIDQARVKADNVALLDNTCLLYTSRCV